MQPIFGRKDDNGVTVGQKERAYEVARCVLEFNQNEGRVRVEIDRWETLAQVMDLYKWEKKIDSSQLF